ncbi:hypothetical protein FQR65_LT20004 [Abscondita terminalis]|nr:hypothetical protein FQR65_LT20004 [Abscondita terminalis]
MAGDVTGNQRYLPRIVRHGSICLSLEDGTPVDIVVETHLDGTLHSYEHRVRFMKRVLGMGRDKNWWLDEQGCTHVLSDHTRLITQQALGGKAQFGRSAFWRDGVWALEAYGASSTP